jgi:hypothetical protein
MRIAFVLGVDLALYSQVTYICNILLGFVSFYGIDSGIEGGYYRQVVHALNTTIFCSVGEGGTCCHVNFPSALSAT